MFANRFSASGRKAATGQQGRLLKRGPISEETMNELREAFQLFDTQGLG